MQACREWVARAVLTVGLWSADLIAACTGWANEWSEACTSWADQTVEKCTQWVQELTDGCAAYIEKKKNQCAAWEQCDLVHLWQCIKGFFCRAWVQIVERVCAVVIQVLGWVCKATTWVVAKVCTGTAWVVVKVCTGFANLTYQAANLLGKLVTMVCRLLAPTKPPAKPAGLGHEVTKVLAADPPIATSGKKGESSNKPGRQGASGYVGPSIGLGAAAVAAGGVATVGALVIVGRADDDSRTRSVSSGTSRSRYESSGWANRAQTIAGLMVAIVVVAGLFALAGGLNPRVPTGPPVPSGEGTPTPAAATQFPSPAPSGIATRPPVTAPGISPVPTASTSPRPGRTGRPSPVPEPTATTAVPSTVELVGGYRDDALGTYMCGTVTTAPPLERAPIEWRIETRDGGIVGDARQTGRTNERGVDRAEFVIAGPGTYVLTVAVTQLDGTITTESREVVVTREPGIGCP